jgi:hypothetical protein
VCFNDGEVRKRSSLSVAELLLSTLHGSLHRNNSAVLLIGKKMPSRYKNDDEVAAESRFTLISLELHGNLLPSAPFLR